MYHLANVLVHYTVNWWPVFSAVFANQIWPELHLDNGKLGWIINVWTPPFQRDPGQKKKILLDPITADTSLWWPLVCKTDTVCWSRNEPRPGELPVLMCQTTLPITSISACVACRQLLECFQHLTRPTTQRNFSYFVVMERNCRPIYISTFK